MHASPVHTQCIYTTLQRTVTNTGWLDSTPTAPPSFLTNRTLVKCHTTAANGQPFVIEIKPEWAPLGSDRFIKLVESGYFTGVPFFRYVKGFLTQFGITPDEKLRKHWREQGTIPDDPNQHRQIKRGYLSFAGGGPNTRDMQLFIALAGACVGACMGACLAFHSFMSVVCAIFYLQTASGWARPRGRCRSAA